MKAYTYMISAILERHFENLCIRNVEKITGKSKGLTYVKGEGRGLTYVTGKGRGLTYE